MDTVLGGCEAGNSDLLTLAQRGDRPLLDALGLEREAQFALKVEVPAHRALIVRVSVNDDFIDDARLAPRLDFLATHRVRLARRPGRQQGLDVRDVPRRWQLGEQTAQVRIRLEFVGSRGLHQAVKMGAGPGPADRIGEQPVAP